MFLLFHDTYCTKRNMSKFVMQTQVCTVIDFLVGPLYNSNLIAPVKFDEHDLFFRAHG